MVKKLNLKIFIAVLLFVTEIGLSQTDTLKSKLNYGITLSGMALFTPDKNSNYYKNSVDNYPVFYNIGFYLSKKRHWFDMGITNQITNISPDAFYYSLGYSYRVSRKNNIADLSATIKTISYLYQIQNPSKDLKQNTYNDMIVCLGPTLSKNLKRLTFHLNLLYIVGVSSYLAQYKNGHIPTLKVDKPQYSPAIFLTELKVAFRLNRKTK